MVPASDLSCENGHFVCCETEHDLFLFTGDVGLDTVPALSLARVPSRT